MILCVGTTDPITAHFKFTAWLHSTQIICYIVVLKVLYVVLKVLYVLDNPLQIVKFT